MRVSVIIPTYNRTEYMMQIVEALLRGNRRPDELIIVDDSPHWDLGGRLSVRAAEGFEITYIKRPDLGFRVASARRLAIAVATGEIIVAIQDATLPGSTLIEAHAKGHEEVPHPRVLLGYVRNTEGNPNSDDRSGKWSAELWKEGWGRNISFTKKLALEIDSFDPLFDGAYGLEDVDFSYRAFKAGAEFIICKEAYCVQLLRLQHITQRDQSGQVAKFVQKHGVYP